MRHKRKFDGHFGNRQHKKQALSAFALILTFILLLCCLPPGIAQAEEKEHERQTIRVGFFGFDGYHQEDENGNRSGYGYDFLQRIAPYANFEYEYIGYDKSWSDMLRMLENGEIDIVTSAKKTPEREELYEFSRESIGTSFTVLTTRPDNLQYTTSDYSTMDGIRVGFMKGSVRVQGFDRYAKEHGFSYYPVFYQDEKEILKALSKGDEIDAVVTSDLRVLEDEIVIDKFDEAKIYVIARKGDTELMKRIDSAMEHLNADSPGWNYELADKYYNGYSNRNKMLFTTVERLYIDELNKSGKKLHVLVNPALEPYSYFKDGQAKGILVDLLDATAKKAGFTYEIIETASIQEYLEMIRSGEADLIFDASFDYNTAEQTGYYLTSPYYTATYARMTYKKKAPENDVVAIRSSNGVLGDRFLDRFVNGDSIKCSTFDECVEAVKSGKASCTYVFTYTASKYIGSDYTNSFDYEVIKDMSCPISVAVRNDCDMLLYSVINKTVSNLDPELKEAAVNVNTQYNVSDNSFWYFVYNEPVLAIAMIIFIMALVIALILWFRKREKKAEQIHREIDARQREALTEAYEAADRANQAKSEFLSGISHDIRTPLNAIIGMAAIASAHTDDPAWVNNCLAKITTSGQHLLGVINEVLDMSKIESGKVSLTEEAFNLAGLMDNLIELVQPGIRAKGHELKVRIHNITHENVIGDSLRIQQAFVNIVGNATKYTPDGGKIEIEVSELPSKTPKIGTYQFVFRDNGIGMSQEYIKDIFDPFSRERGSQVHQIQGTGLGMAITKNIVQMMDGSIKVESEPGKGSTFTVIIRLKLQSVEMEDVERFEGLSVLVVDDDQTVCEGTCMMLGEIGMVSEYVTTGIEAVDKVSESHAAEKDFYAVIIDWKMPQMDGLETVRAIRAAVGEEMPIIIMTAYDWSEIEEEARAAGVSAFLSKPLFKSKLIYTFDEVSHRDLPKEEVKAIELLSQMNLSDKHLLLVEDNELNREIACEIIGMTGIRIDTAENGEAAVQRFRASAPGYYDLILMDVQMPVMNGYDASMAIRALERTDAQTVPIVAMTADAFAEDVEKALAAHMNEHLAKPLDIRKLADMMKRWLAK